MKNLSAALLLIAIQMTLFGCGPGTREQQLQGFISAHVEKIKPMAKESHLAYWEAANSGGGEDYNRVSELEFEIRQVYSDADDFALLRQIRESGQVNNPLLARQLEVLYHAYLENQIDPGLLKRIVELGTEIEKNFSTFRGTMDGEKVTDNEIREVLKTETESVRRKKAWLASKQVGPAVAGDLVELVKLRNEAAQKVGFDNYHALSLTVAEQDVKELDRIFEELYQLTNKPFAEIKGELDGVLAAKYGVSVGELRPWHYHDPFFQESPLVYDLDLDVYYKDKDVKKLAVAFYDSISLPVDSILVHSDLYEREGKNPHAFCTDIDREGDVRILCNLKNNEQWMETILHELGHAVYDRYHDPDVPFLLREPAHIFTTEAIAMLFGRLSRDAAWMQQMLELSDEQRAEIEKVSEKYATLKQLIFVRWAMVMYEFEKELYRNPDQDLNSLWWDMVEKYQLVKRPEGRTEPDWAAKIHFTIAPVYYHNYVLGELLASQLHHRIVHKVLGLESDKDVSYVGQRKVGDFLRTKVFEPGAVYQWNDMIARATGEPLNPEYFVAQFVR
ncbi:MAG TPA: M2 family metallopeptidase [Sedimentisphaerales bacterium]|nr:M2 family metallopeptidase [Sedimentisphaerales bacterium]